MSRRIATDSSCARRRSRNRPAARAPLHPPFTPEPAMSHFKALMTAIYPTADLAKAKAWYAEVFGVQPYFDEPFYVGFNVAGYELGLMPVEPPNHQTGNQGAVAYWGVADCAATHARVLALGAKELGKVQ